MSVSIDARIYAQLRPDQAAAYPLLRKGGAQKGVPFHERWLSAVDRNGPKHEQMSSRCWVWLAATNGKYGVLQRGGRTYYAHRYALELLLGRTIQKGCMALHRCDTPLCVRPSHLREGTHRDNMADSVKKDRHSRGSRNHHAKLTEESVRFMRIDRHSGVPLETLAQKYGVTISKVSLIVRGLRWKHVGGPITSARLYCRTGDHK